MKIIIIGAGELGQMLAEKLRSLEANDVTVVDSSEEVIGIFRQGKHEVFLFHLHMLIFNGNGLCTLKRAHGLLRKLVHVHTDPSLKAFDFL